MRKNEYRKRKVHSGELRTPVIFYEYQPVEGPYPDQEEKEKVYSCWAKVESVWLRDLEQAKQNGTESDVTLTIRDPLQEFIPTNKHFIRIDTYDYKHLVYNITTSQPDLQHRDFIKVIASLKDDMKWE